MNLRSLQITQLSMLEAIIDVCDKLGLQYFMVSGSLLGAIRHNGFIPWDEDIDIALPRPDYDVFIKSAARLLPKHYFLQTHQSDNEFLCSFSKLRDIRTTFVEKSLMLKNINHGVYVDIFPLDGFPDKPIKAKWYLLKNRLYNLRLSRENYASKRSMRWKLASTVALLLCPSVQKTWEKRDKLYRSISYEGARFVANLGNAWGDREVLDKGVFQTDCVKEFEGLLVSVPAGYHQYLSALYGEYMKLPPRTRKKASS